MQSKSKFFVLLLVLMTLSRHQGMLMVHSQDIEMQNRHYFAVKLNGVDMMRSPIFRPDIPISHQYLVLTEPEVKIDDYEVGDEIPITWFAILPDDYKYEIINMHLYYKSLKEGAREPIINRLYAPKERMSFRKHLSIMPEDQEEFDSLKAVLEYSFTNSSRGFDEYLIFRRNQGGTIDELTAAWQAINDEDLIPKAKGRTMEEKKLNWEAAVLDAEDDMNAEISRVYTEIMVWLDTYAKPNMNVAGSYPFLADAIWGEDPEFRTYFHTRTYNVKVDDVETKGVDRTHDVLTMRCWFEFSLEFPGKLELAYMNRNKEDGNEDSDVSKYNAFMTELADIFSRRRLIM